MSGSRWVTTPSWLSGSLSPFLYSSSMYSCHILISSASLRLLPFLPFMPIFALNIHLVSSVFLRRSLVFPSLLFSSISLHCSFKNTLSVLAILWNSTFSLVYLSLSPLPFASLLFSAICKAPSDSHFAFLHFFFLDVVMSPSPVQCYKPLSRVLRALHQVWSRAPFFRLLLRGCPQGGSTSSCPPRGFLWPQAPERNSCPVLEIIAWEMPGSRVITFFPYCWTDLQSCWNSDAEGVAHLR